MGKGKFGEWVTDEGLVLIEGWARDGLTYEQIAHNMGVTGTTLDVWRKRFPAISCALKKGRAVADYEVENALFKRAIGAKYTEVIKERIEDTGQNKRHNEVQALTEKEWEICKLYFDNKCAYCGADKPLTKDHLQPLAKEGLLTVNNVVPACAHCNSSKGKKNWLSWYQSQSFYDAARAQRITEYIRFAIAMSMMSKESDENAELVVTKSITKEMPPDTTAAIFWLKNRQPKKWRTNPEPDGEDTLRALDAVLAQIKSAF